MLTLSLGTFGNTLIAFMPADRRFYCIYCTRNLKNHGAGAAAPGQ
jgi:hypothetical protein